MARGKSAEKVEILERQLQAVDMRKRGLSFRDIAKKLRVSHQQAYRDVMGELARLSKERDGKLEEMRELELERLDMLIIALEPMARVGKPDAVNSFLKCMERRAKLLGLDAPQSIEVPGLSELLKLCEKTGVEPSQLFNSMIAEIHANADDT